MEALRQLEQRWREEATKAMETDILRPAQRHAVRHALVACADDLADALAASLREKAGWQPPKDGSECLAFSPDDGWVRVWWKASAKYIEGGVWADSLRESVVHPDAIAFAALPPAPQGEEPK